MFFVWNNAVYLFCNVWMLTYGWILDDVKEQCCGYCVMFWILTQAWILDDVLDNGATHVAAHTLVPMTRLKTPDESSAKGQI